MSYSTSPGLLEYSIASDESLYANLTPELKALAMRGELRSYARKSLVLNEGDMGDSVFIVLKGSVKVYAMEGEGREIVYCHIHAGDYFGEMSLDGGPRSASVCTLDCCVFSVVALSEVTEHIAAYPGFALHLALQVIRRARDLTGVARNMALLDVYSRMVMILENPKDLPVSRSGNQVTFEPVTHQDIASRIGASREMVSRLLKDLEKGGFIDMGVRRITVKRKLPVRW